MNFSVVLFALASSLASAAPTGPSPDSSGLSKNALPADSIKARMSDDAVKSARHSAGLNPDVIESPYYLTGELQERSEGLTPDETLAPNYYFTDELQERSEGLNPDVIESPFYLTGELQE